MSFPFRLPTLARVGSVATLLLLVLAPALHAQTGGVSGTVTDAALGVRLADTNLSLDGARRGAVSRADGRFEIAGLAPGTYTLRATSVGYTVATQRVTVRAGETVRADVALVEGEARLAEVRVEGRAATLLGVARAASEGRAGRAEIAPRPLLRVGEVLEVVPGLIATQHSGTGKANQFFLRGFNLDHGTDFSASVEGVPLNLPTHAHGQGYLDVGGLIPEIIDEVAFRKGPSDIRTGDFATAGSARVRLVRRLDAGIARVEGGTDESVRVVAAQSVPAGRGDVLVAGAAQYFNGPWVTPENSTLLSGVAKYSAGTAARGVSLTAMGYRNGWTSTDQVAQRAVASGLVSRLGALDPTNGGTSDRYTLASTWHTTSAASARTQVTAYAAYYALNLFSNFTYFLENPERGDQFEQAERRGYGGAGVQHRRDVRGLGQGTTATVGADVRHDEIVGVGLYNTTERVRFNTVRQDDVGQTSAGAYAETDTQWARWLRTTLGVRGDVYRFRVESDRAVNSGTATAAIASPRLSVAVGPWRSTEGYLNVGLGFHSNDARGTTITVDPATGEAAEAVDPLVRTRGAELGVRTAAFPGVQTTLALWAVGLDSELVFVGDAGGTEAGDASRHVGIEFANHVRVADWASATLDVALTDSRFTGDLPDGNRIENSIGRVVTGGVYAGRAAGPLASMQLRHFGPRPLNADGSVRAPATTLVNARAGYGLGRVTMALDVLNVLGSEAADVSYLYASRLRGEPAAGVEDVHAHPVAPRAARLSAVVRF